MPDRKEEEYELSHSNDNLTDSSQSSLQTVLVTFRVDKPSVQQIKRVRFNSLVEVKFIPRRRKDKKRKNKLEAQEKEENSWADDATEKAKYEVNPANNGEEETDIKGEVSVRGQWVATATEKVPETVKEDSCTENAPQKFDTGVGKVSDKPSSNSSVKAEKSETATSLVKEPTKENSDPVGRVYAGFVRSRRTVRTSYTTNKITLGEDYIGNAMRLGPATFSITPPIQFSEFPARNAKRQSVHELGSKAVWRLEKQAEKFCQEAEALITQITEKNAHIQSKLKQQPETLLPAGNQRHAFPKENATSRKPSITPGFTSFGKPVNQDVFGIKPVTRFPYINHKKQQSIVGLSPRS